jgi:cyclopropane-fatty-acyl-phospholipid synthase
VTVRFHDAKVERELFFNPELASAEAYMDGRLTIENGSIYDLLFLFSVNRRGLGAHPLQQALRKNWRALRRLHQQNPLGRAGENVRRHYDHPADFYALWLDEGMNYSCAYFTHPDEPLEAAQRNKLRHVAGKLKLAPGMRVLDIGSGWGALAIYLAQSCAVEVTALNVSAEQLEASRQRARAAGVEDRIRFVNRDYREITGPFDRVVSMGMMEHGAEAAGAGRIRLDPRHRPHVAAGFDRAVHPQIYLPWRLCAGAVGGVRLDRTHGIVG